MTSTKSAADTDELVFDDSGLNTWTDEERFDVTRDRLAEYAAATNDPIPAHRSGEVAPPVFAIVPVFEALLVPAVDVLPVELIPRVVHGEQDFHFHRPIRPGDKLVSRGKMIGYEGLENGTRAAIYLECRTEDGELVNEQYVTTFVRDSMLVRRWGSSAPPTASTRRCVLGLLSPPWFSISMMIRRSGTVQRPAIRCRSTWTRRWLAMPDCPASSPTVCAPWRSPRGRC